MLDAILDWLSREGTVFLSWWLLVTLAGAAVLPLCWRLLGALPDKGYTLARAVGLLLTGFVFWLLANFGFLQNTPGSMVMAWLLVLLISVSAYFYLPGASIQLREYWRENRGVILSTELLFFVLLLGWSIFRAFQNDTFSTEKPMEMAFISGIMRSETFPPNDAWLAGFSISYYYFGYVMTAMLSMLSGVSSGVGFSMINALMFALTGITAFGVAYNLVRSRTLTIANRVAGQTPALLTGMLALVFVILLSNYQAPLVEIPYQTGAISQQTLDVWGHQGRFEAPPESYTGSPTPDGWDRWWWFRASRVLTDFNLDGTQSGIQPIDEFPQFSFLLSDNHPHVLALPFVLLSLGMALNLLLMNRNPNRYEWLFYGIVIGGLIFLNTWDGPIHLVIVVGADALRRLMRNGGRIHMSDWLMLFGEGVMLLMIAFVAYLPFFVGFRSQAAGIVPNLIYPTALQRYFLMFGPLLIPVALFLVFQMVQGIREKRFNPVAGISVGGGIIAFLVLFLLALVGLSSLNPAMASFVNNLVAQNGGWNEVMPQVVQRRIDYLAMPLLLLILLIIVVGRLFPRINRKISSDSDAENTVVTYPAATGFVLLLIAAGVMLSLIPEFFYLRDNFGVRINTIFKFYYQTWILFSIAGAYGIYSILSENRNGMLRVAMVIVFALTILPGLPYSVFGVYSRMMVEPMQFLGTGYDIGFLSEADLEDPVLLSYDGRFVQAGEDVLNGDSATIATAPENGTIRFKDNQLYLVPAPTLDGRRWMVGTDDFAMLQCLSDKVSGSDAVVLEAERDAYNARYGRVGSITGIPSLLGWDNHQRQWRGSSYGETAGTRDPDINAIYTDVRFDIVLPQIQKYEIDYIVFGQTERDQYGDVAEEKFLDFLPIICEAGNSRVFAVDENLSFNPAAQ